MTHSVTMYEDEVLPATMNWVPALEAGDAIAAPGGIPDVALELYGSENLDAALLSTANSISRIKLGPHTGPGSARVALSANTVNGFTLGETIHLTVQAR